MGYISRKGPCFKAVCIARIAKKLLFYIIKNFCVPICIIDILMQLAFLKEKTSP